MTDTAVLAEMVIYSGENLITHAFGGNRRDALISVEALCRTSGTMFSYKMATVAIPEAPACPDPIAVVIAHPSTRERLTARALADVLIRERGWWRVLQMAPIALALQRCSEPIPADVTYVSILAVHPDMRSLGIGSKLLRHAETCARNEGDQAICLDVEIDNPRAISFYERNGYQTESERPGSPYLRSHGIAGMRRMFKDLTGTKA
ncbi:MAG: N-acetyltransferase [Capsulimonadaceae bacterium]|nr:N-acetyltransferase [Capsulimonadaceae bacterium]